MSMTSKVWLGIASAFKMHGYSLRSDAGSFLKEILAPINEVEREDWIDRILDSIQKLNLETNMIDLDILESAVKDCENVSEDSGSTFTIINAFLVPKYIYNSERKKFFKDTDLGMDTPMILSCANDKAELFRDRYKILYQRTVRHKLFTPLIPGAEATNAKKFHLRNVEYLQGCSARLKEIIVLGMVTQLKESKYHLEDLTGAVALDLSEAKFHSGLFTENSFVLAEGWYEDDVFHVSAFGFPPSEPAKTTRAYYGNINFFGGESPTCAKASNKLLQIEQECEDAMFLFLSDVWLDRESVLKKLETLFIGFSESPPTCIVLSGPFCSTPYSPKHKTLVKDGLANLAKIITKFPLIQQETRLVFVPSSDDLGLGRILPRPPLPPLVTEDFQRKFPNAVFASNPCRIQYCTQEIVVFREDIIKKMCRNAIKRPSEDIPRQFVKSVLSQGHLSPLPLHVSPVHWAYDHSLRLYPLPDLIVFCDHMSEPFKVSQLDCTCVNTGSFSSGDFTFKAYYPSSKEVDDSKVDS